MAIPTIASVVLNSHPNSKLIASMLAYGRKLRISPIDYPDLESYRQDVNKRRKQREIALMILGLISTKKVPLLLLSDYNRLNVDIAANTFNFRPFQYPALEYWDHLARYFRSCFSAYVRASNSKK
jgi:hypothetical protein